MGKKAGIVLLGVLTLTSVVMAAAPSAAEPVGPASPKGQVFAGLEAFDASASPWVVALGSGPNPVPLVWIDYEAGLCSGPNQTDRLPAIITGLANVGPNNGGLRSITADDVFDLVCANAEMLRLTITADFTYDVQNDYLMADFPEDKLTTLVPICRGTPVDIRGVNVSFNYINGTQSADTIEGTSGPDIIDGRNGKDTINAKGGFDIVCAGNGNDVVHGNGGLDLILGEGGRDQLFGDAAKDVILGGKNPANLKPEVIKGGAGWDRLFGWLGRDNTFGGTGNDILWGGPSFDKLYGGQGPDDECYDKASNIKSGCEITGP